MTRLFLIALLALTACAPATVTPATKAGERDYSHAPVTSIRPQPRPELPSLPDRIEVVQERVTEMERVLDTKDRVFDGTGPTPDGVGYLP